MTNKPARLLFASAAAFALCSSLSACGKKKSSSSGASVAFNIQNLNFSSDQQLALHLSPQSKDVSISTANVGASFMPVSVKMPIMQIGFVDPSTGGNDSVFQCQGTSVDDCTLDLMNNTQMAAAFGVTPVTDTTSVPGKSTAQPATNSNTLQTFVGSGTYSQIYFNTCNLAKGSQNTSFKLQVKGVVVLGGTTYYTTDPDANGGDPLTTTQANWGYVSITNTTCQINYPIPNGLTLAAGSTVMANLFTDVSNLGYAITGTASQNANLGSNCVKGPSYSVCLNMPAMVPYVGTSVPTTETYKISVSSQTVAELEMYIDSQGDLLGVAGRPVYDATTTTPIANGWSQNPFNAQFKNFSKNADGTYNLISTGGSTSTTTATDSTGSYVVMSAFSRVSTVGGTSTGSATSPIGYFTSTASYTATRE